MRHLLRRQPVGLLCLILSVLLLATGCGNSSNDFVADGTTTTGTTGTGSGSNTGSLVFNFTQGQTVEVPSATARLLFTFFDADGNEVFSSESDFATTITISGVPTEAVRVEITALDSNDGPLASVSQPVTVEEDATSTVDLSTASVTPITVSSLAVTPQSSTIGTGSTVTLVVTATYSNGTTVTLPNSAVTFQADSLAVSVDQAGVVTGVNFGVVNVSASLASAPSVSAAVAQFSVSELEVASVAGPALLPLSGSGTGTSFPLQVHLTDPDGNETNVTNSPGLLLDISPDTLTGLSIVDQGGSQFAVGATQSNATAGDTVTVTATLTDVDGAVYTSTLEITVATVGSPP